MLLHFILFLFVVCTAEICEFHSFYLPFLCLSLHSDFLLSAPFDACNNFFVPLLVVSLCMPQERGTCGHLKGSYDSHFSCLNCSGCSRFNCCAECHRWSDSTWEFVGKRWSLRSRQMGKKEEPKEKKQRGFYSRSSSCKAGP